MSKIKTSKKIQFSALFLFALAVNPLCAEISLGNKGAVTLGIDADAEYDSNIGSNSSEVSDTILSAMPKLLYRYDQGVVRVDAFVGMRFTEYVDESQFDSESIKSRVSLRYPREPEYDGLSWTFTAGYNESTTADNDLQSIVERERTDAEFSLRYDIAERYYLRGGIDYFNEDTKTAGFSDIDSLGLPIDFFYRYSETLAFGFGVEFRDVGIDSVANPTADSADTALYFALEGSPRETLEAELKIGWQQRDFDASAFEDDDAFFMEAMLSWILSERSTIELSSGSGFRNTARNQSIEERFVKLAGEQRFDEKLRGLLFLEYSEVDFETLNGLEVRSDDRWGVGLDVYYELIEDRLALELALRYSDQSSDVATANYEDSMIRCGISYIF